MEKVKRFLLDDSVTKIFIIASVVFVLAVEIIIWCGVLQDFFIIGGILENYVSNLKL